MAKRQVIVEIAGDTSGLDRAAGVAVGRLSAIGTAAQKAGTDTAEGLNKATTAAGRFTDASGRMREANGRFVGSGNNAGSAIGRLGDVFDKTGFSLGKLTLGYFSAQAAFNTLKQAIGVISNFQRIDASLKAVSGSSEDLARTQNFLAGTSDRYGLSIEALSKSYVGFKANTNDTILRGREAERIFLSVAKASAALQLSTEDTTGTLRAFGQMLSKGTVQSEELKGQVGERLYNAFGLAAKAMNVTTMELNNMLASGQVMAVDLLPKLATEIDKTFGAAAINNVNTMAGGWTRATDQLKLFVSEFAKSAGIDTFFAKIGNGLANYTRGLREANQRGESLLNPKSRNRILELSAQAAERDNFRTMTPGQRDERMAQLNMDRDDFKNKADNPGAFGYNDVVARKNREEQLKVEERLKILRRENRRLLEAEGVEAARIAKIPAPGMAGFDIDKAKDRQAALAKLIANGRGNNQNVAALQKEYDKLTAKIDKATESTKKHKESQKTGNEKGTYFDLASERLAYFTKQVAGFSARGLAIPTFVTQSFEFWTAEVERGKDALAALKPVDLGSKLKSIIAPLAQTRLALEGFINPLSQMPGLLARFGEVGGFGSLSFFENEVGKLQSIIGNNGIKNIVDPDAISRLEEYTQAVAKAERAITQANEAAQGQSAKNSTLNGPQWNDSAAIGDEWGKVALANLAKNRQAVIGSARDMTTALQGVLSQGAVGAAQAMGDFVGGIIAGTAGIEDLPRVILTVVADMLQSLAQALAASAAVMLFVPGLQAQAASQLAGAAGLFAVAGLARGLAQPKRKATAMAGGGTVYKPTYSLTGEYPGASRDPEFVAPASKGAGLIADQLMSMGGFGGGPMEFRTKITGEEIDLILSRYYRNKKRG